MIVARTVATVRLSEQFGISTSAPVFGCAPRKNGVTKNDEEWCQGQYERLGARSPAPQSSCGNCPGALGMLE